MAFRDDIVIDWSVSPRIVRVLAPSDELTIQDLVDTCRELEQRPENMVYESIISAAGKEALGGSVTVGITATLLNAQVQFEARLDEDESGTATSGSSTILTDTAADFVTAGVARGSVIINYTDGSVTDVLDVIDSQNLRIVGLSGGTDNDFDIGDSYAVFNVDQTSVSGGNLVAVDTNDQEISSILPTFGTQVVRTASSSATLQELEAIQFASYNGGVTVDPTSTYTGMNFPVGTAQAPVNNFSDALDIATERGFVTFFIVGSSLIDTGLDFSNKVFVGQGVNLSVLTLHPDANFLNTEFYNATVQGTLDGNSTIKNCQIQTLTFVTGVIEECILSGTITLGGTETAQFIRCTAGNPVIPPVINLGGAGPDCVVRDYSGGLKLTNKTGTAEVCLDMASGAVVLDSTLTSGSIHVRGIATLTDNSTGATVDSSGLLQPSNLNTAIDKIAIIEKLARNRLETDPSTGQMTLYDDDNVTPLLVATIYEDVAGTQTYQGQGAERRNRLT